MSKGKKITVKRLKIILSKTQLTVKLYDFASPCKIISIELNFDGTEIAFVITPLYLTIGSCFSVHYRVMEHAGSLESTPKKRKS